MRWLVFGLCVWAAACGGEESGSSGTGGKGPGPTCSDCTPAGDMTFALPSPAGATLWTTTTMDKVLREAAPPEGTGDRIELFAAKNEYEPFQVVVWVPAAATATLDLSPFTGVGSIDGATIRRVGYVNIDTPTDASSIPSGRIPDPLEPTTFGASEALGAGENQPFWITVYVPEDAAAGDYEAALSVSVDGASVDVPVSLHVYDFALPSRPSFDGSWNASMSALGGSESLEKVEQLKDFFFGHRLVPSSVAWPAGLNYDGGIEYDCASGSFLSEDNPYDFSQLGPKYVEGDGWNGAGFGSLQVMRFVDNSTPRPQQFCGVDRGSDHFGTAAYNAEWSKLLAAIDAYLVARGWEDLAHYYVQNEPQNEADYELAAFLAQLTKAAAPNLRIAVSEEPKPEIAEHPMAAGASYDMWWANLSGYDAEYAETRQAQGEQVWWYFLYGDRPPYFNPITIDHAGIESRIGHWAAFGARVTGFAYYSVTGWGSDPYQDPRPQGTDQNGDGFLLYPPVGGALVSSIRWELLREGVEDYEYLLLANAGALPSTPSIASTCDASVASAVSSPTSYTRDASALKHLRDELGLFIEGAVNGCPTLQSTAPGAHPRAPYFINFQDPNGAPSGPLNVDGQEWLKIGWEAYDVDAGFGWAGPFIGDASIMLYQHLDGAPVDETQRSIIYNDYGRTDTFNWDIENGSYSVTVSVGWQDKSYDKHRVVVEGDLLFDDAATTPATPYDVRSVDVTVSDGNVTLEVGQQDEYTMLNWMSVVPLD
jgi:Glycoside hydrolase 123, catalytic domain